MKLSVRAGLLGILVLTVIWACQREDTSDQLAGQLTDSIEKATPPIVPRPSPPAATVSSVDPATAALRADSLDKMLRKVRNLSRWEQMKLRKDVNAIQIARARQLGIRPSGDLQSLLQTGTLVELPPYTRYWTLHNLSFSVPYVTPSMAVLLTEIGQRFQARLDSLNVPPLRMVITSALRTPENQAALRRRNSNASKIESAHEFGTTVDIAYRRFAAPEEDAGLLTDSLYATTANKRSAELQAVLGRVLQEMQAEGKVMVMMERRQTVYHITVARQLATPRPVRPPPRAGAD